MNDYMIKSSWMFNCLKNPSFEAKLHDRWKRLWDKYYKKCVYSVTRDLLRALLSPRCKSIYRTLRHQENLSEKKLASSVPVLQQLYSPNQRRKDISKTVLAGYLGYSLRMQTNQIHVCLNQVNRLGEYHSR